MLALKSVSRLVVQAKHDFIYLAKCVIGLFLFVLSLDAYSVGTSYSSDAADLSAFVPASSWVSWAIHG